MFSHHGRKLHEQNLWKQSEQLESTGPYVAEEFLLK